MATTTAKPLRAPEEIEDIILSKIFLVTQIDSMGNDTRAVYLEMTAAEILSEGGELRFSRDVMERVLVDRRAYEGKKITNMKDKSVRAQMELVVNQAKYCRIHLVSSSIDTFGGGSSGGASSPPGFLDELFRDSDYDSMETILKQLYEDLRGTVLKCSALGNFQQPLRALMYLISFPVGAKALVNHQCALPDQSFYKSQPDVGEQCFMDSSTRRPADLLSSFATIKSVMNNLYDGLAEILRAHIQVDPMSSASSGMFVNLSAVMLRLCEPFLDANSTKKDKIDPKYVFYGSRLDFKELTALHASLEEVTEWLNKNKPSQTMKKTDFKDLVQDIQRREDSLATLKTMQEQTPSPRILRDGGLLQLALSFYQLMVVWLVSRIGGFKMPLPRSLPMEFACMPEHFVEDVMELLIFASRIPHALDGVKLDDFMNFIIMFMASPEYIRNPYLRAKMVEVLNCWMPRRSGSSSATSTLFEWHLLSVQYLVKNLLKLYVDVEFTGSHTQFYDKFNIRHNIAKLLEYLWQVPVQQNAWKQIAKEEEKGSLKLKWLTQLNGNKNQHKRTRLYHSQENYTLMKDPVILPSSRIIVDRPVIQRHLLSDPSWLFLWRHLPKAAATAMKLAEVGDAGGCRSQRERAVLETPNKTSTL
ncbi:unnamed protein product [Lactuca saligna]|uniref:Ubiquitin conjugation factor E4 core domain-containing protein n=1 Tax=Lactuca saligna TaxID=75948 RepID=A0AA35YAJ2_LACSI|nr:unnamed protein product [Lactuca saligna]